MFMVEYQEGKFIDAEQVAEFSIDKQLRQVHMTMKSGKEISSTSGCSRAVLNVLTGVNVSQINFERLLD